MVCEAGSQSRQLTADHLVLTLPSVQMLDLFDRSSLVLDDGTMERLRGIRHTRCLALLGLLEDQSSLDHPGTVTHPDQQVDWLSDNQRKGISELPSFTLHANDEYSQKYWDASDEERVPHLLGVAEGIFGARSHSMVRSPVGIRQACRYLWGFHWHSEDLALTLAGDGFGGRRVENAALSGVECGGCDS